MDFFQVIQERRSVRAFTNQPVEEEKLRQLLEAINACPSAGNLQAYEVVVVRDPANRRALAKAAWDQEFIAQAPVALVFCVNPGRTAPRYGARGAELYCVQDATIATTIAHFGATALGLASVWVGAFDPARVARVVGATGDRVPVAILPLGYAAETPHPTPRRPLADLIHEERL